ncbi:MAG: N-acetylmuramic acid 6-phosphate etherase [Bacteroidota bacterium]
MKQLEQLNTESLLTLIHKADQSVRVSVGKCLPDIIKLVDVLVPKMKENGRLFYLGAGTSGRLGIIDASEIPPTFGVSDKVIGIIAGGDSAIRKAVEHAEDDFEQGWKDLQNFKINKNDFVIGISASGNAPYVIGAVQRCHRKKITTGCITCNPSGLLQKEVDFPVVADTGEEIISGSTRMKAGTAQKMILNMISTATMIRLGHVMGNRMVDMQLSNNKLIERGTQMLCEFLKISPEEAKKILLESGSVRKALQGKM